MIYLDTTVAGTTRNENGAGKIPVNGDLNRNAEAFTGKPSFLEIGSVLGLVIVFVLFPVVFDFVAVVLRKP